MSEFDKPAAWRIVPRMRPSEDAPKEPERRPGEIWTAIRTLLGFGRKPDAPIDSQAALSRFLDERASFVAQTSLYGYLRTRAGMRYPELFEDDPFVASINVAKWHLWLDCLSDLSVYAGSRLAQHAQRELANVARITEGTVAELLDRTGTPSEAGDEFAAHAAKVRSRVARTDWLAIGPDDAAFSESPASLVRWAPIVDELKALDEEIVLNSVRFRWQDVRRDFARLLVPEAILSAGGDLPARE